MIGAIRNTMLLLTLTVVGCPDSTNVSSCLSANPGTSEADFQSDRWHTSCPSPPAGNSTTCPPPTITEIESRCSEDGHDCTGQISVSKAAALCIARENGLEEGLEGLHAELLYNYEYRIPIWATSNVLYKQADSAGGKSLAINASDGKVIERTSWMSMSF